MGKGASVKSELECLRLLLVKGSCWVEEVGCSVIYRLGECDLHLRNLFIIWRWNLADVYDVGLGVCKFATSVV